MRRAGVVVTLVVLSGVAVPVSGCPNVVAGLVGDSVGVPLHAKVISSKVEPNVVIAVDGTICEVTKGRWEQARVGREILCSWSDGGARGTAGELSAKSAETSGNPAARSELRPARHQAHPVSPA